jgi:CHAD domain-containing protein
MATEAEVEREDEMPDDGAVPGPRAVPAGVVGSGGDTAAGDTVMRYLREQRDAILRTDPGVRGGDPDAVHDMRVATRRLRATLRTFGPLFEPAATEPLREELRWLGERLGAVRETDVLADRLASAIADEPAELVVGPVAARIAERLAGDAGPARARLLASLDGKRYAALLESLDRFVDAPPPRVGGKRLRRLARKALRRGDRRLAAARRARSAHPARVPLPSGAGDPDAALHSARKAYKRARYAAEALVPLAGRPAHRLARRLTGLQDALGAHRDAVVAAGLLRDYGIRAHLDGDNAFSYGLLHARQREAGARALAELPRAGRRAGRRKVRRWLR